jgi:GR25 family glycosyltransferase involved in LPS biosynthesis
MQGIHRVYYINLEHRADRKNELLQWIGESGFPLEKVERVPGVYNQSKPHFGCSVAHINALETFIKSGHDNCLILEDDFEPNNKSTFWNDIDRIFKDNIDYDVVMCAFNDCSLQSSAGPTNYLIRMLYTYSMSGYIITRRFAPILMDHHKDAVRLGLHEESITNKKAVDYLADVYWCKLMPLHKWYAFYPKLGHQRPSFSDIEQKFTDYGNI